MPNNDKHAILLKLEAELHAQIVAAAKQKSVSITEYIRQAIKTKLDKPEPPPIDLFSITPAEAESNQHNEIKPVEIPPVRSSDKTTTEYWLERIRQWAGMPGAEAMAQLDAATGGIRPPASLFGSAPELAKWLEENATK